jgi:hypothetical protein
MPTDPAAAATISPTGPRSNLDEFLAMPAPALLERFVVGVGRFDRRALALPDAQLDTAFLPDAGVGRWPVRVLLGHLADAELCFAFRMRRVVGEDNPVLEAWDENSYIDRGLYGTERTPQGQRQAAGAFVATVFTLRKWVGEWLRTLDAGAWQRKGLHTVRGEQTLRTILAYDTWHLEHHAWYLNAKIVKLMGPG